MSSRSRYRSNSSRVRTELNLTPLVDMVFILLIFFLVTSHFSQTKQLDIQQPKAPSAESGPNPSLEIQIDANDQVFVQGQHQDIQRLDNWLQDYAQKRPNARVLIAADANSRSGSLVRVLDACRQAGLSDLNLSGSTEQER